MKKNKYEESKPMETVEEKKPADAESQKVDANFNTKMPPKEDSDKLFGCPECPSEYETLKEVLKHVFFKHGEFF